MHFSHLIFERFLVRHTHGSLPGTRPVARMLLPTLVILRQIHNITTAIFSTKNSYSSRWLMFAHVSIWVSILYTQPWRTAIWIRIWPMKKKWIRNRPSCDIKSRFPTAIAIANRWGCSSPYRSCLPVARWCSRGCCPGSIPSSPSPGQTGARCTARPLDPEGRTRQF